MFNKKEITTILASSIVLAFLITLLETTEYFLYALLGVFIVILANSLIKKVTAYYVESDVEIRLWEFKRFGYKTNHKFKKNFPAGIVIPLISKVILFPLNGIVWMGSLVFDVKAKSYRAAKRHGFYSFTEMSEKDIALIAASGILLNLILAVIGYLLNYPLFFKMNLWYAFFNMIPVSDLDGNKIFFGNNLLWILLAILSIIGIAYSMIL